jgi:hypothetical protein
MHLANPDGVSFCVLDQRAIFLDIGRDRYFAISARQTDALVRALSGTSIVGSDEEQLQPLLTEGLLMVTDEPHRHLAPVALSPASSDFAVSRSANVCLVLLVLALQFRAHRALRRRGLASVVAERARPSKRTLRRRPAEAIAAAAHVSDRLVSAHERCLMKAIALFDLLALTGHRPALVLGVRDHPFTAHAWVQLEGRVVGDRLESIELYQPILVI